MRRIARSGLFNQNPDVSPFLQPSQVIATTPDPPNLASTGLTWTSDGLNEIYAYIDDALLNGNVDVRARAAR